MSLRVGIVGAGWIGQWHAARWKRLPVALAGFHDIHAPSAEAAASTYGGQVFPSVDALARAVDLVLICSPSAAHREAVLAAAALGKHVFCEKPLARTLADALEIVAACERAGVRLYVGHVLRFFPQYLRVKQLVYDGAVGRPGIVRLVRAAGHPASSERRAHFGSLALTGGCMMEGGLHDLDFARWTFGEVERVFARGLTFREDLPFPADHALVTLRFASGMLGHVESSWMVTDGRFRQRIEVAGDRGLLAYDALPREQLVITPREAGGPALLPVEPLAERDEPYFAQLAHVLDCLEHDREFRVSPRDGVEALRLSLATVESMRTGAPVRPEEVVQ